MTILQICTAALLKNGQHETLATDFLTNPTTKSAELCSVFYDQARKTVLRMQAWTCAKKRTKLYGNIWEADTEYESDDVIIVMNGTTPEQYICTTAGTSGSAEPTWDNAAAVTDGTAEWTFTRQVMQMIPEENETQYLYAMAVPADYIRMVMVLDENGERADANFEFGILYTDTEIPTLVYIMDNQDTATWDPLLTDAIILQLASSLAYPLTGSHENEIAFGQSSAAMVRAAFTQSKREQRQGPRPTDQWTEGLFPARKQ